MSFKLKTNDNDLKIHIFTFSIPKKNQFFKKISTH